MAIVTWRHPDDKPRLEIADEDHTEVEARWRAAAVAKLDYGIAAELIDELPAGPIQFRLT